jgi:hypothetical protein
MGSLLPSNTFGGIGQELFVPVGGIEPEIDVIVQGTLTVLGNEVSFPDADLILGLGDVTARSATLSAQVSCNNLDVTDLVQCARATITGELTAGSLELNGPLEITNLTADSVTSIGAITGATLAVAGDSVLGGSVTVNGTNGAIINGPLNVTGNVSLPNAALSVASLASAGAMTAGSGNISGNLFIGGALTVASGIDPPPIVPGFQCSSIKFGQLLIAFGSGGTGFDGSVTYTTRPFTSVFSISATGNSGVNCLYARNTENGPAGSIRLIATNTGGVPTGAGVQINMIAFLLAA